MPVAPHVWRKQLLPRAEPAGVVEAVEAVAGVYGTAPTCYLSLAARVPGFRLADLDAEAYERRRLARVRCMRGSAYLVSAAALPVVVQATRGLVEGAQRKLLRAQGVSAQAYDGAAKRILAAAEGRALTAAALRDAVKPRSEAVRRAFGTVVQLLCAEARLVRARPAGTWRSDAYAYARWEDWLPGVRLDSVPAEEARARLARLYLRAFGPASGEDFRWWSGLTAPEAAAALAALAGEITELPGGDLLLADQVALLEGAGAADGVRLLPVWDTLLMGYGDKSRLAQAEGLPRVYDSSGNATSVVAVDGEVAGVWSFAEERGRLVVKVAPLGATLARRLADVRAEAEVVAASIGLGGADVLVCPDAPVLGGFREKLFLSPLRDCEPETR